MTGCENDREKMSWSLYSRGPSSGMHDTPRSSMTVRSSTTENRLRMSFASASRRSRAVKMPMPARRLPVRFAMPHRSVTAVPAISASLAYFDAYRSERLPANLTQGQRDYFGAHTYRRVDKPGVFHTEW